jgi:hypothetical protein
MSGEGAGAREAAEFTHVNLICRCVFIRFRMYEFVYMNSYIFILGIFYVKGVLLRIRVISGVILGMGKN